jgi:hypothetical protein
MGAMSHRPLTIGRPDRGLDPSNPAATVEPGLQPEPVSPELVLVDAALAARERARLEESAQLQAIYDVAALRRAVEWQPPPTEERLGRLPRWREAATFSQRRFVTAALLCSLLGNGFFAAEMLSRTDEEATPVAVRMVTLTETAPVSQSASSMPSATTAREEATTRAELQQQELRATSAMVEGKIVSLIVAAPAKKLPPRFVDRTTGLVKNNVQVVCRRDRISSFICAVRLPADAPKSGIYVRYQVNRKGKDVFRWYGYRRG